MRFTRLLRLLLDSYPAGRHPVRRRGSASAGRFVLERLEAMAGFFEAVTELYDQMKGLPTGMVRKLLRMGTKVKKR